MLSPEMLLLLKAALFADGSAMQAWQYWVSMADLESLPPGAYPVLPLLYGNIQKLDPDHPWQTRLKGVVRHTWANNQIFMQQTMEWEKAFIDAGVDVRWITDATFSEAYYLPEQIRPLFQRIAILPRDQIPAAVNLLQKTGKSHMHRTLAQVISGVYPYEPRLIIRSWLFPGRLLKNSKSFSPAEEGLFACLRYAWEHPAPHIVLVDLYLMVTKIPGLVEEISHLAEELDLVLPLTYTLTDLRSLHPTAIPTSQERVSKAARWEHHVRRIPNHQHNLLDKLLLASIYLRKLV